MAEYFELLDEEGNKLGKTKEREAVHRDGDIHGGSHVWVIRNIQSDGSFQVLLQRRRRDKDSFPGCLDVSCAGHMTAGETFISTALRELEEELGISTVKKHLKFLFKQMVGGTFDFYGTPFKNYEVNYVYLLDLEVSLDTLYYQREEIEELIWMDVEEVYKELLEDNPEFCIWPEEFRKFMESTRRLI
ncbi:MAG: NUDIX domain-containing protein [Clostridia bacterium]|nr:NUDIX domain-containing protein [Lachnospiraceae bacterium]NCC00295.1 NUDIX domain-containing protein [Clostridia bacterium]NCD02319.1 NUDIX domain-containing protein [Clostridia bacterium]